MLIKIKRHPEFDRWINGHKDRVPVYAWRRAYVRRHWEIWATLSPLAIVYLKCVSISAQVWRMYFVQRGKVIIVMLGGGDKSTQAADITKAQLLASNLED
jgi:putative addiction module killer protein